jgi:uncharacterized protein YjiS (DUF1127 family)
MTAIRLEDLGKPASYFRPPGTSHRVGAGIARLCANFAAWRRRARDRERLAKLDNRMLADIGVSRAEAEFLSNKPVWRE